MEDFVLYKLPQQTTFQFIKGRFEPVPIDHIEQTTGGFVFSNFNSNNSCFFLKGKPISTVPTNLESFLIQVLPYTQSSIDSESHFQIIVNKAKQLMNAKDAPFKKVVLANQKFIAYKENYVTLFLKLCEQYPNAFCYLCYSNLFGAWIGASPELLIEQINPIQFRTVSLAGTLTSKIAVWSAKERNEQQLVTDFIANKLTQSNFNYELSEQNEIKVGILKHLISEFNITPSNAAAQNLTQLVSILHPTPAVAGLPRENALSFIAMNEGFERNLYAGFFGIITDNYARINVNLRCAQLFSNGLLLYAGAGITADSDAQLEWQETQNKMKVSASLLY
jgi:isochorismate synthase